MYLNIKKTLYRTPEIWNKDSLSFSADYLADHKD